VVAIFLLTIALTLVAIVGGTIGTALAGRERRLVEQAITDPLTGAFNRRHMTFCLAQAVARRARTGEPATLLLIDVDFFKRVNDTWGHAEGDAVLTRLVKLIASRGRRLDVLFRTGGEEFVLLLPETSHDGAVTVAEAIREAVASATLLPSGEQLSISIGVSELAAAQSLSAWIEDADAALYRAKRSGRNRVAVSRGFALSPARVM
jgi:diguanylate cyclase (GGDEF)-like protein